MGQGTLAPRLQGGQLACPCSLGVNRAGRQHGQQAGKASRRNAEAPGAAAGRINISQPCPAAFLQTFPKAEAEVWALHRHCVPFSSLAPSLSPAFLPAAAPQPPPAASSLHPSPATLLFTLQPCASSSWYKAPEKYQFIGKSPLESQREHSSITSQHDSRLRVRRCCGAALRELRDAFAPARTKPGSILEILLPYKLFTLFIG